MSFDDSKIKVTEGSTYICIHNSEIAPAWMARDSLKDAKMLTQLNNELFQLGEDF